MVTDSVGYYLIVMEPQFRRILETSMGQVEIEDVGGYTLLPHQYLSHPVSPDSIGEISIGTYQNHLKNPYNTTNTSITSTLFLHQIQHITKPLIVDASSLKDISLFKNIHIVKGSRAEIQAVSSKQGDYLYSKSTLKQTLQNKLILNEPKCSFIGQLNLPDLDLSNQYHLNYIEAALQVCKERGCFLLLNMINNRNPTTLFDISHSCIEENYQKLSWIVEMNSKYNARILLFNPLILVLTRLEGGCIIKDYSNLRALNIYRDQGVIIGYDFSRYESDKDFITLLSQQINNHPTTTVISTGVLFKTDLASFGGNGWRRSDKIDLLESLVPADNWAKVRYQNMVGLLFWKREEIVIRQVEYWRCSTCDKKFSEESKKFRKMEKSFCSTACIRGYKF